MTARKSWKWCGAAVAALSGVAACGDAEPPDEGVLAGNGGQSGGKAGSGGDAGDAGGATGGESGSSWRGGAAGEGGAGEGGFGTAGGGQGGGVQAGAGAGGDDSGAAPYPELLSQTNLFADIVRHRIADDAEAFRPSYELWSDGADKQRWVRLPPGATIDTTDLDYWRYPVDTELFKEFSVDGKRIETRLLRKSADGWVRVSYLWNEDETDAVAVPDGVRNARGTTHDVPSSTTCAVCHDKMPDNVLGFTLLQLAHEGEGITLTSLVEREVLSEPPEELPLIPGDDTAREALGYLHSNCGICHNPESFVMAVTEVNFWLAANRLGSVETTPTYSTAVGRPPTSNPGDAVAVIEPGSPDESSVILRMRERGSEEQMPPVASELPDEDGIELLSAWIDELGSAE